MPVWNGVTYEEFAGPGLPKSPAFTVVPAAESRCEMQAFIDWTQTRNQAATTAFCGMSQVKTNWPGTTKRYLSRTLPFSHPDWPPSFFLCESLKAEGNLPIPGMTENQTANFDKGKVTLGFKSFPNGYRVLPDDAVVGLPADAEARPYEALCLRDMECVESQTTKAQTFQGAHGLVWDDDVPVSAMSFVTLYETDIVLKWYPVPLDAYNEAAFLALVGKTNSAAFPPKGPAAPPPVMSQKPPQTLVMGTPGKELIRMGNAEWALRVTLKMKFFPYGAQFLYRTNPPTGSPRYMRVRRPDGSPLFEPVDFAAAFLPPVPP